MTQAATITADWIGVDWGTSRMRLWAMSQSGTVLQARASEKGMGALEPTGFEPTLLEAIDDLLPSGSIPVVCCGMVGSRQGWVEAPYVKVPCPAKDLTTVTAPAQDSRLNVRIISGVMQQSPADVMRGEETQIAGFLSLNPNWDGVICLPGTHTKWAHISANEIVSFRTSMTGELYALLSKQSVLRHSITTQEIDTDSFLEAVSEAMARPERLATGLFSIRSEGLLNSASKERAASRLSGLLIGAELASQKAYWLGQQVALIGSDKLSGLYDQALRAQGVTTILTDATAMTLAGLKIALQST